MVCRTLLTSLSNSDSLTVYGQYKSNVDNYDGIHYIMIEKIIDLNSWNYNSNEPLY